MFTALYQSAPPEVNSHDLFSSWLHFLLLAGLVWSRIGEAWNRAARDHGEKIANELNERVAKGEPGIPVYQGHPDVAELASKYPDKGALGWVTHIELVNEGSAAKNAENAKGFANFASSAAKDKGGLLLHVEWDRDPGRGFKWFSPYWFANESERQGNVHMVGKIASIGLVNNPNIAEFRLANEAGEDLTRRR